MGTHPIFESDFDCLTELQMKNLALVPLTSAMFFWLAPATKKCIKEEVHKDVVVTGLFDIGESAGHKVHLKVTDSKEHILYNKETATKDAKSHEIEINLKKGVEAKSYEEQAKTEKLKPLEVELRRLEDMSDSIVMDFQYMKSREEEMRSTNESTNTRVLYFSIFSMVCLVALGTWQVFYLRRFFKSKKLIE